MFNKINATSVVLPVLATSVIGPLAYYAYKKFIVRVRKETKVLVSRGLLSKEHVTYKKSVPPIVHFINEATSSLDLAFPEMNDPIIIDALVRAKKEKKVKVRLILDYNLGFHNNEAANEYFKAGIDIYTIRYDAENNSSMNFHFGIRDKAYLYSGNPYSAYGSFAEGMDIIIVSNDEYYIKPYLNVFNTVIAKKIVISGYEVTC